MPQNSKICRLTEDTFETMEVTENFWINNIKKIENFHQKTQLC